MKQKLLYGLSALTVSMVLLFSLTAIGRSAITELSGIAVAQTGSLWKNVRDYLVGDNMPDGVMASGMVFYDASGNNGDRLRGSIANGILVDVTRQPGSSQTPADAFANPTTFQGVWSLGGIFNGTTWDRWRGQVAPSQGVTVLNSETVSAADTANVVTLTGVANTRIHIYRVKANCAAGTSVMSITDHAVTKFSTNAGSIPQVPRSFDEVWPVGLTISTGSNAVVTVATCGAGNVSAIQLEADQF